MNVADNWRTTEWRLRMSRDWSHVPNWNRPYNLRENEEAVPDEFESDRGFSPMFAVGMLAYEQQR